MLIQSIIGDTMDAQAIEALGQALAWKTFPSKGSQSLANAENGERRFQSTLDVEHMCNMHK
jgi:hypothetical protein